MSAKVIPMQDWIDSLEAAARELTKTSLRFDRPAAESSGRAEGKAAKKSAKTSTKGAKGAKAAAREAEPAPAEPGAPCGTYIAVLGEANAMHLGLTTSAEGCQTLARGLLGLRTTEELSQKDAVDGISEIMNILAGKVKSRMSDRDHGLRLGMPIFMQQPIQVRDDMERVTSEISIGPVACQLSVFRAKKAA